MSSAATAQGFIGSTGEYKAEVEVHASMVVGPDPFGTRHTFIMDGWVLIREWPYPGYAQRVLADGRVQIDLEMVASAITANVVSLGTNVHISETTSAKNYGTLTQVVPGQDFPARFDLLRMIEVNSPLGVLHNKQPIQIHGIIDCIPPLSRSSALTGVNVFQAVNTPVPLFDVSDNVAAFFSGDAETDTNCKVRMIRLI
jgi:hypothetical protein